jgi:hypothetical protein
MSINPSFFLYFLLYFFLIFCRNLLPYLQINAHPLPRLPPSLFLAMVSRRAPPWPSRASGIPHDGRHYGLHLLLPLGAVSTASSTRRNMRGGGAPALPHQNPAASSATVRLTARASGVLRGGEAPHAGGWQLSAKGQEAPFPPTLCAAASTLAACSVALRQAPPGGEAGKGQGGVRQNHVLWLRRLNISSHRIF